MRKNKSLHTCHGFTLVEILVSITLLGIVLTSAYSAFQTVIIQQGNIDAQVDITKDIYYYSEKFFELVEKSGNIDYEEYWNRRVLGYEKVISDGIYTFAHVSDFGNGGYDRVYSCISRNCPAGEDIVNCSMENKSYPESNCFADGEYNSTGDPIEGQQAYGQYSELFFDRNKNANDDGGDEDADGNIRRDFDDRDTGQGPEILGPQTFGAEIFDPRTEGLSELYLIRHEIGKSKRTFFRHVLMNDEVYLDDHSDISICDPLTRRGCIGTIQMIQLDGIDTTNDGRIDTWDEENSYADLTDWINIFPPYIDVREANFFVTPTKHPDYAWNNPFIPQNNGNMVQSSVRIHLGVELSYERQRLANRNKEVFRTKNNFTTTINLGTLGELEVKTFDS